MFKKSNRSKIFFPVLVVGFLVIGLFIILPRLVTQNSSLSPTPFPTQAVTGETIELSGQMVCLPHKDTSGPQTLECAYGLKTPEGFYYALRDSDPEYKNLSGLGTGEAVTVSGTLYKQADTKYQSEGIIEIQAISK